MLDDVKLKLKTVNCLAKRTGVEEIINLSKFLNDRIKHPESFVTMLGETSSGKTTLLNGLLGGNYLYTSPIPSTGAIIELEFTPEKIDRQYYAVFKDAATAKLSSEDFIEYSKTPNDNIRRLCMKTRSAEYGGCKMRLFDTPGYGSVIEKHEEVLTEFLPESNIIIYVVSYRVGFKEDDFNFIKYVRGITTEDTEFILVINLVPEEADIRHINGIKRHVSKLLHYTPEIFLAPDIENNECPLPRCDDLWAHLKKKILSEEYQKRLEKSFEAYVFGLYDRCNDYITQMVLARKLDRKEKNLLITELESAIIQIEAAKDKLVRVEFKELISAMPSKLATAKNHVIHVIDEKIDASKRTQERETVAYVNSHMQPIETERQLDDILTYIKSRQTRLTRQIEGILNRKYEGSVLERSLLDYFRQFAGQDGTGVANGEKHLIKKIGGELFDHTISWNIHSKLVSALTKIGIASAKVLELQVGTAMEVIDIFKDMATWQSKFKKKKTKDIEEWHKKVKDFIQNVLKDLEAENIQLLDKYTDDLRRRIEEIQENDPDEDKVHRLTTLLKKVKEEIGEYSHE